jgi:predicted AAA+ superfamily ATPase
MTDQELKDLVASLAVKSDKLDMQLAKTDAKLDRIANMVGGISSNQGDVAEEFFYNSLRREPVIGGVRFDRVQANTLAGSKGKEKEFDIVLVNGSSVALIEVKFKAHLADLEQAEKQVAQYRDIFPEHKNYTIYSGIAAFSVPPDVVDEAHKKGLFVLKQVGELVETDSMAMRAL